MKVGLILATDSNNAELNVFAPIGLGCLAASINRHLPDVELILTESIDDMLARQPDLLGISATTEYYHIACQWAATVKQQLGIPIIVGGVHISLLPESLSDDFDVAVIGEGDFTIIDLIVSFQKHHFFHSTELKTIPGIFFKENGTPVLTPPRPPIADLDALPRINWKILPYYKDHHAHIVSARGCPYKCAFCASEKFARTHRYYSAESIVNEIEYFVVEKGLGGITFYDDLLIANKKRLTTLIEKMDERGLLGKCRFHCQVRANLVTEEICELLKTLNIFTTGIGIESFSDKILKYYNKTGITGETNQRAIDLLSQYGIRVNPSIIFGAPIETRDDMMTTLRAIYRNIEDKKLSSPAWTLLRPYPGTAIWDYAEQKGLVSRTMDWSLFSNWGTFDMYMCEHLPKEEFKALIHEWQTKISLIKFDTIHKTDGNFIFNQRQDIYDKIPPLKNAISQRQSAGAEEEIGDAIILATSYDPDSSAILVSGWYNKEEDGTRWIKREAQAIVPVQGKARLLFQGYLPPAVFDRCFDGTIGLELQAESDLLFSGQCTLQAFPDGLISLDLPLPHGKDTLLLAIRADKSFVPAKCVPASSDVRDLSLVVATLQAR